MKKNILIIIVALLFLGGIIFYIYLKKPAIFQKSFAPTIVSSPTSSPLSSPTASPSPSIKFKYTVGDCENQNEEKYFFQLPPPEDFSISVDDKIIRVSQKLTYVCCAKINIFIDSVEVRPDVTLLNIKESNTKEMCDCVCNYKVNMEIGPVTKGDYLIHLWGVEFQKGAAHLLFGRQVTVK